MKNGRSKIKIITILSLFIALLSLGIGYSAYNINNDTRGTALVVEGIYDIKMDNINNIITSNKDIKFRQDPVIVGNEISFSLDNLAYNNNASFKFDIYNDGNVDVIIKNIEVSGLDNYKNIEYSFSNIEIGDIIKGESKILDNTFNIVYKEPIYDNNGNLINVNLDDVVIKMVFEQVK